MFFHTIFHGSLACFMKHSSMSEGWVGISFEDSQFSIVRVCFLIRGSGIYLFIYLLVGFTLAFCNLEMFESLWPKGCSQEVCKMVHGSHGNVTQFWLLYILETNSAECGARNMATEKVWGFLKIQVPMAF